MKQSRNDSCWCKSGRKYKSCHYSFDKRLSTLKNNGYPIPGIHLIKSEKQIKGIRKSCQLTKSILDDLNLIVKPGITTNEINDWVYRKTIENNAIPAPLNYKGFPKSICTSINDVICHGIPENRILEEGDIINVDVTCILDGYYGDSCRMYAVGDINNEAEKLIQLTKKCLDESIKTLNPYDPLNVIGNTIQNIAHKEGYSVVEIFGGHGVGNEFHEEPFVYHQKRKEKLMICAPGMVFTIEPMINIGTHECVIESDGWTAKTKDGKLSAQWEHTICIHEDHIEILT